MEIRRFFAPVSARRGNSIFLSGEEFHHLTKVLRYKEGYKAIIYLNDGKEYHCTIKRINGSLAECEIDNIIAPEMKDLGITLFCALLKGGKTEFVVQKAVEIGANAVIPFVSEYTTENKFSLERLNRIALEACKQCGSPMLTDIGELKTFDEVIKMFKDYDKVIFAYEKEKNLRLSQVDMSGGKIALVVGSEGGFSDREANMAKEAGAIIVSLGERILRAETASIAVLAAASLRRGGM
ncbi:MAG: 16S rRNA (uracil(1498)-N(3))-methyltransferase [Clostridiales bacterium]|nr:16S rRNA (uracil(1498)-N(3))-methyltransferase [Clostridiales bacterium]